MYLELIIECLLNGNEKQKQLSLKILQDFMIKKQELDNGKDN